MNRVKVIEFGVHERLVFRDSTIEYVRDALKDIGGHLMVREALMKAMDRNRENMCYKRMIRFEKVIAVLDKMDNFNERDVEAFIEVLKEAGEGEEAVIAVLCKVT